MRNFFGRFFSKRTRGSKRNTNNKKVPFRLNFIFAVVGVLFAMLIARLAYMQLFQGNLYKSYVNQSSNTTKYGNVQRGMIYDSTGKVLVGNTTHRAIVYTKGMDDTPQNLYDVATKLGAMVKVPTKTVTTKQAGQYYLSDKAHVNEAAKQIPGGAKLDADALEAKALSLIEKGQLVKITPQIKNDTAIFTEMSGAYQFSSTYIKPTGVTNKEVAEVGEHASEMPGVQIGTSWSRNYPSGKNIQALIGTVSNDRTGLPADHVNELLSQGYSRNDSVGQSSLEQEYEPVLRGSKSQTQVSVGGDNQITKEVQKYPGQRGLNLQLSINSKFQNKLDDLTKGAAKGAGKATGAYAVVMNPKTGAVYGMSGVNRNPETGKVTTNDLGPINTSIVMGSVVKGATVSGALMDGVITPHNSTLTDHPLYNKSSWFNKKGNQDVTVNAQGALEISSNSYMMQLIMKEAGFKYAPGKPLYLNPDIFQKERYYFNMFGLGQKTGIDLPGEVAGVQGPVGAKNSGKALDESFGNYDAYTLMQVAQYMSTIANGGNRIKPHVVQDIRSTDPKTGQLGAIQTTETPQVLNTIPMTPAQKNVVTQGLYQVVHGTQQYKTGGGLQGLSPAVAGKTGTAQTFYKGQPTVTLSLASYAPAKDPQVVVAVAIPNLPVDADSNNINFAKDIYGEFWKDVQAKP